MHIVCLNIGFSSKDRKELTLTIQNNSNLDFSVQQKEERIIK